MRNRDPVRTNERNLERLRRLHMQLRVVDTTAQQTTQQERLLLLELRLHLPQFEHVPRLHARRVRLHNLPDRNHIIGESIRLPRQTVVEGLPDEAEVHSHRTQQRLERHPLPNPLAADSSRVRPQLVLESLPTELPEHEPERRERRAVHIPLRDHRLDVAGELAHLHHVQGRDLVQVVKARADTALQRRRNRRVIHRLETHPDCAFAHSRRAIEWA
ncbi:hypothetical protein C5B85_04660 [Pseudoclavibacter sp. AY1F1]|nr:hypothetical protein C5B85_04660 [Pseudoclavibacter sp. AY1F1]